ncbi:hypothetical protein HD597_001123 [Nonomuraea thailandensis]|uniref:Uncharacterized protein n=1 Tax=Nonomuraea thailandensis TaxID=1188745 RepID=A0A9X2GHA5_9ACTN|nr:hypothetical protein [Nonomuraea thailandensis]
MVVIGARFDGRCPAIANGRSREWTFKAGSYDKTVAR